MVKSKSRFLRSVSLGAMLGAAFSAGCAASAPGPRLGVDDDTRSGPKSIAKAPPTPPLPAGPGSVAKAPPTPPFPPSRPEGPPDRNLWPGDGNAKDVAGGHDGMRACVTLGEALYNGQGADKDAARAVRLFRKACDAGEPTGCVDLGWAYFSGTGAAKDAAAAATQFGKACTDKVALGCFGLGMLHRDGTGIPKDAARAAALFKQACDGGVPAACKVLTNR